MADLAPLPFDEVNARDAVMVAAFLGLKPAPREKRKYACIDCKSSDGLHAYKDGSFICFVCRGKLPGSQRKEGWSNIDAVMVARRVEAVEACKLLAGHFGILLPGPTRNGPKPSRGLEKKCTAQYIYRDADRRPYMRIDRMEWTEGGKRDKEFVAYRPDGKGGWTKGTKGLDRIPYKLPEALAAIERGERVLIVEGEKKVDALAELGFVATCNPFGAGGWNTDCSKWLNAADVVLLPDMDTAGKKHVRKVADELDGLAQSVRILVDGFPGHEWTDSHGFDVADWIEAGHDETELDELLLTTLEASTPGAKAHTAAFRSHNWPDLKPLQASHGPPLPIESLPDELGAFVLDVAASRQLSADMALGQVLGGLSVALAKKARFALRPDFSQPVHIYAGVVARPAERKSAAVKAVTSALDEFEEHLVDETSHDRRQAERRRTILRARVKKCEARAAQPAAEPEDEQLYINAQHDLDELERAILAKPRLLTADATPEAVAQLMNGNHGRIAVLDPEADPLSALAGARYNKLPTLELLKKAWTGGEALRIDRKTQEPLIIPDPALTLVLSIQPRVLEAIGTSSAMVGEGLLARFLWVVPEPQRGSRLTGGDVPEPTHAVRRRFYEIFRLLLESRPQRGSLKEPTPWEPREFAPSPSAREILYAFEREIEDQLASEGPEGVLDWRGKLFGNTLRLAALLQAFRNAAADGSPWAHMNVESASAEGAVALARAMIPHATVVFEMVAGRGGGSARLTYILGKVQALADEEHRTTVREVHRAAQGKGWVKSSDDVAEVLAFLNRLGHVRIEEQAASGGRSPSPMVTLHPDYWGTS